MQNFAHLRHVNSHHPLSSDPICCINLIVNICVKLWKFTSYDWMEQMQMIFVTTGLKCATTWFEQFLRHPQTAISIHQYWYWQAWSAQSALFTRLATMVIQMVILGNTDGNGPKWQCAGSSCRIARRFNAPFQSRIGISIRYFKHFNLIFRTFQSVRQLITQSGGTNWYGRHSHNHVSAPKLPLLG